MTNPKENNFLDNLIKINNLYQEICVKLSNKKDIEIDPFNFSKTATKLLNKLYQQPEKLFELQSDYLKNYMLVLYNIEERCNDDSIESLYKSDNKDNRFKDTSWNNIYFDSIKQFYLLNSYSLKNFVSHIDNNDKSNFFIKQFIDAISPSNFIFTNPIVLKETIETNGQNLINGLNRFLKDLDKSKQFLEITTVNEEAFTVGKNIATTKGKVIYQNDLIQLIKYDNVGDKTYSRPLLVIPPWINKYYILDLRENNSFIKWLTEQNFTVYIISWINPDESHRDKNFEDYMHEGIIESLNAIEKFTGTKQLNAIGYCLGGTLLTATLAYMTKINDTRINSATLLTTLIDFSKAGDLLLFTDEEQLTKLEDRMNKVGYFSGEEMALTFSTLKANDMIWSFFVNNYLLGKEASNFDLLYWNSDTTRLPAKMHSFYLRNMYQKNLLIKPNALKLKNVKIDISQIRIPCYFLSTKDDHIAPWQATYSALDKFDDKIFTLTASGHIAGVVNHPDSGKYCYWTNKNIPKNSEEWLSLAKQHDGSWWNSWLTWIKKQSGKKISISKKRIQYIEEAPGSYVNMK